LTVLCPKKAAAWGAKKTGTGRFGLVMLTSLRW
jgi:hypothetical protein